MPHRADPLLVNVGRARLQLDPVVFQRADRVVQDERGAVVLLVLPTGIVDESTKDTERLIGLGGCWPFARGALRDDLPVTLAAVVLGDGGDGLLFPRLEGCGYVTLNLGLAAVLELARTPHVCVGDRPQRHLGGFVRLLHVARVDALAHVLQDAPRLLAPLVFGELSVWANREADRFASDAPLSHEDALARSSDAQPVPLQRVVLMNFVPRCRCLHLVDVGLCQFRHVVSP